MTAGRLDSIWIASVATERPHRVERIEAVPGRGLVGDRYARGIGTFSPTRNGNPRDLTLIAAESVEAVRAAAGADLEPGDLRRNLVIGGLDLPGLVGARLRIGPVLVECTGTCPPCGHLDRLLSLDSRALLRKRGGLRARILVGGELVAGATVTIESPPRRLP